MEVLQDDHPDIQVHSVENSTSAAITYYEDVPKMVPLDKNGG